MNQVHTFQCSFSRFILILSSHLYISLSTVLFYSGTPTVIFTDFCMSFLNAIFYTHPNMIYVVNSTNYESHCYALCLPSCHFLSFLSVLDCATHFTSLICRHVSLFMYFVCKRVCTSCEALTVVLLVIQVFQDVRQFCLDLLFDKYLHSGECAAQIIHNLK